MINSLKERIAQLVHIEDVIEYYISLFRGSKSGKTLECHCPFHPDNQRSLKIRKTDQVYECIACGENGNIFSFIQLMEGCELPEALRLLIDRYQIPVQEKELAKLNKPGKTAENILSKKSHLFSTIHLIREYNMILSSLDPFMPDDAELNETFHKFEVSFAPDILPISYQNLCAKCVMPVRNEVGEIISFLAHNKDNQGTKTYLCVPAQSEGYFLFGLHQALDSIQRMGFVYLMDSYQDVLLMHAAGFCNVVSYDGKTITKYQLAILQQKTNQVVLLHNDETSTYVKCFKIAAKLSHTGIQTTHVCYNQAPNLGSFLGQVNKDDFYCFVHENTRYGRLVTYKTEIENKIEMIQKGLEFANTVTERAALRSELILFKQKLMKVSKILDLYPPMSFE